MIDKRLVKEVDNSMKYVLLNVGVQWVSLICNIVIIFSVGNILVSTYNNSIVLSSLYPTMFILLILIIIRLFCALLAARFSYHAAENVKLDLRLKIYDKLLKLGPAYSEKISTSEVVQVAVEGVDQLEIYFGRYLPQLFYSLLAPLTLFIIISFINLPSALILFVCVPLIPVSIILVQKFAKKLLAKYWGQYTTLGDSFLENIEGLTTLKIYEADEAKNEEMNIEAEHFRIVTMKVLFMQLNSISVMDLIAYGGAALGLTIASSQYLKGNIGFASAFAIILLSSEFFIPLRLLGSYFHIAMNGMAASDKIFDLLDIEAIEYGSNKLAENIDNIEIKDLSFNYIAEKTVLNNINMNFEKGLNAIVGESGSGKSTIAKLLSLQNTDYSGLINLNDNDLKSYTFETMANNVMLVAHNAFLFKGSVRDNLLMGNPNASDEDLWDVIKQVRLDAFLNEQAGLDSEVMANGANLSGGQKQRLGLARALLSSAQVFIFDEATSNIDTESEAYIMDVIRNLSKDKIVIVISHRLFNTVEADKLYVINQGHLIESGKHDELLNNQSKYFELYESQSVYENFAGGVENEN
ncbi:MAG: ABC transporter ATP-binding protein/permease [Erysipelothrix sp.]|nr:ABC transporter ATP-binding protein/permease [Erysipelothrix sp.]